MHSLVPIAGLFLLAASAPAHAQAAPAFAAQVGERGAVVVAPVLGRPAVQACVVTLFDGVRFDAHGDPTAMSAQPHAWHYAPTCPGPWAKVVLEADFSVSAGRQFDRSTSLWLDGVNLFYGTTQEPGAEVAPAWHVERDLTDYASLFRKVGAGQTLLNNWVDAKYTGVIRGSAKLLFYPATAQAAAPRVADRVLGLDGDAGGAPVPVPDGRAALSRTLTLPRNVERVWLDVIAQSQSTDEQWYMCIDDADLGPSAAYALGPPSSGYPLQQCGNGNHRVVEVSIDGQPAGRAPVYPWTYTGGVDPHLWRPVPDVQTLNFVPYRIDLTPFAALLDDGKPHTVAVRVPGAHQFFNLAANLLLRLDPGRAVLGGRLLQNTLASDRARLEPRVTRAWKDESHGGSSGEVDTLQQGDYAIAGVLDTSHGAVTTRVTQQARYSNRQQFRHPDAGTYRQTIAFDSRVTDIVTRRVGGNVDEHRRALHYPLQLDVLKHLRPGGAFTSAIDMRQGYAKRVDDTRNGKAGAWSSLDDMLESHATTDFNAGGTGITGSRDQHGSQTYRYRDSLGSCVMLAVHTRDEAVAAVASGEGCPGKANRLDWRSAPDAM